MIQAGSEGTSLGIRKSRDNAGVHQHDAVVPRRERDALADGRVREPPRDGTASNSVGKRTAKGYPPTSLNNGLYMCITDAQPPIAGHGGKARINADVSVVLTESKVGLWLDPVVFFDGGVTWLLTRFRNSRY